MADPLMYSGTEYDPRSRDAREMLQTFFEPGDWETLRAAIAAGRSGAIPGGMNEAIGEWGGMKERILNPLDIEGQGFVGGMMDFITKEEDPYAGRFSDVQGLLQGEGPSSPGPQGALLELYRKQMEEKETALEAGLIDLKQAIAAGYDPDWRQKIGM